MKSRSRGSLQTLNEWAQLGCFHARSRVAELPTDADDEQTRRRIHNLATSSAAWKQLSVDEIVALYTQRLSK